LLLALDRKQRDREQVSQLLATLVQRGVLQSAQVSDGFALLLKDDDYLSDLLLDSPDALTALAQFVARAVVDGVLPASFLSPEPEGEITPGPKHGTTVLSRAATIHSLHNQSMIGKIWGPGDGRPVEQRK
jgi:programmed cell death protein 4